MTMSNRAIGALSAGAFLALVMTLGTGSAAHAQTLPYAGMTGAQSSASSSDSKTAGDEISAPRHVRTPRVKLAPYLEAAQVVFTELAPGNDTVTYSSLAAGVDASVRGRNNEGALSLRYERRFAWGDHGGSGDSITGVARGSAAIVPRTLTFEAGALAARSRVESNGAAILGPLALGDAVTQIYSVYAGPSLTTHVGDVAVNGSYRAGYTRVKSPKAVLAPTLTAVDVFDHSTVHSATLQAATRAGELLPIGVALGVGYNREDISNLDQRVSDFAARADVTLPVTADLAVVGGVGYENVEISSRDALRDALGNRVVGSDGRYVTDKTAPRVLAYDVSGLLFDAGVIWRPSRRTALEAHVGRRYGSTSVNASFAYAPDTRSSFNVSVYDNVSGFGSQVNRALADLPTQFEAARNPLNGDLTGCVVALSKGNCLSGALGSVRSATFRARGVAASYGVDLGRIQAGVGAGYDRRKFIAAAGTVLAVANGVVDSNTWVAAYLNGRIDRQSSFSTNAHLNWFQSGFTSAGETTAFGASAAYNRLLGNRISATAAVGLDGTSRDALPDFWSASALVGVRYSF